MGLTQIPANFILDDSLKNADIASDAAIAQSKIANLTTDLAAKQATLISGSNIKTINSTSLLGSGNIAISGLTAYFAQTTSIFSTTAQSANVTGLSISSIPAGTYLAGGKIKAMGPGTDAIVYCGGQYITGIGYYIAGGTSTNAVGFGQFETGAQYMYMPVAGAWYVFDFSMKIVTSQSTTWTFAVNRGSTAGTIYVGDYSLVWLIKIA